MGKKTFRYIVYFKFKRKDVFVPKQISKIFDKDSKDPS